MGKYTVYEDHAIDLAIETKLKIIIQQIASSGPVLSIILGGGFGRGEGSVICRGHTIQIINDFDLFVVTPDNQVCNYQNLSKKLAEEVQIRLLDLIQVQVSDIPRLPATQFYYDLKYGGQVLWGADYLSSMPAFEQGCIDNSSIRTILLNRLICAIEAISFTNDKLSNDNIFFIEVQTGKVVSACVEALLMKKRCYHHCYQQRSKIFQSMYPERGPLIQLCERATSFKLRPKSDGLTDVRKYWKHAMSEYLKVLAECLVDGNNATADALWSAISNRNHDLTNHPIERIEIMVLLADQASFFVRRRIINRAWEELEALTLIPRNKGIELLRRQTTALWHELLH